MTVVKGSRATQRHAAATAAHLAAAAAPAGTVAPVQRIQLRMLLILGAMSFFGPLCIDLYLPALPAISRDLHSSESGVQASLTACLIGIAAGQILVGTISDRVGRRQPLLIGLCGFILASAGCAFAPNILALIVLRFLQGVAGSAGVVICRAVARDLYSGSTAARFYSMLMTVTALGPIVAPQIGAGVLHFGSWRLVFVAFVVSGAILLAVAFFLVPETLAPERRHTGNGWAILRGMREVGSNKGFLISASGAALATGAIFAYISGSSFVLEEQHGLSPSQYGLVFGLNAVGLLSFSQIGARIVGRFGPARLLSIGLGGFTIAAGGLLVFVITGWFGLAGILVCLFLVMSSNGFVLPNATALAINDFPHAAGTASALLGVSTYMTGAIIAPLVGIGGGANTALSMAIIMASLAALAVGIRITLSR
jgi:DHA1 family bicyclomycin/chloramphenicol resistance-like MFS transporter